MLHIKENSTISNSRTRKLAVITGATSGIGRAFAIYFASQGHDLIITGRRKALLKQLSTQLERNYFVHVDPVVIDLSKKRDLTRLLHIVALSKDIDVLINNAGYGVNCAFSTDEVSHQMEMMKVHVDAPLMLIHRVLPHMVRNKSGIIINVSSLAATMPTAFNGMYSASKLFLRSFTESLHMDVVGSGIKVQCLCPGFTQSDFHRNNQLKEHVRPFFWMTPEQVVNYSVYCLKKGQVICIPGFLYRVLNRISLIIPRKMYYPIASKLERTFNPTRNKTNPAWY